MRTHWKQPELSAWDWFVLWVEDDATQLGMEVTTYYFLCSLVGLIQGLAIGNCIARWW